MIPYRIKAIADGESDPNWWISLDGGTTYRRADYDQKQVHISELILVANGKNDPELSGLFPKHRRACYRPHLQVDGT